MLDHLSLTVSDFDKAVQFYTAALAPLGYQCARVTENGARSAGFGRGSALNFWISDGAKCSANIHFAFLADDHKTVEAFHMQAMAAGGRDNGAPGLRTEYHASYYTAFVLDPDGNNIEVVCHFPGRMEDQFSDA